MVGPGTSRSGVHWSPQNLGNIGGDGIHQRLKRLVRPVGIWRSLVLHDGDLQISRPLAAELAQLVLNRQDQDGVDRGGLLRSTLQ
jgi:hypothetical protein